MGTTLKRQLEAERKLRSLSTTTIIVNVTAGAYRAMHIELDKAIRELDPMHGLKDEWLDQLSVAEKLLQLADVCHILGDEGMEIVEGAIRAATKNLVVMSLE